MPIRLGTNKIKNNRVGSNTTRNIFVGFNQAFGVFKKDVEALGIDHYWWNANAKDSSTTIWTDTGNLGGDSLSYSGTQTTYVGIESGEGGYVTSTNDARFDGQMGLDDADDWSLRMWFRNEQDPTTNQPQLLTFGKTSGTEAYAWVRIEDQGGNDFLNLNGDGLGMVSNIDIQIERDTWYMFTITADITEGEIKFYLNDSLIGTETYTGVDGGDSLILWDSPQASSNVSFRGDTKLLAGYESILTPTDVEYAYLYDLANNF